MRELYIKEYNIYKFGNRSIKDNKIKLVRLNSNFLLYLLKYNKKIRKRKEKKNRKIQMVPVNSN